MNIEEKKNSLSDALLREDFKKKLKSWFENKGIDKKLESYLRSQMIVEFQNTCGTSINSARGPSLSPKLQAVKLLVADFLVQEDLLFSLSVFVSEVPFLSNLSFYSQYVKAVARPLDFVAARPTKPKFSDAHLRDLCDALSLKLSKEEIHVIQTKYGLSNCSSLLVTLLSMLPVLLKKYRSISHVLSKMRQKEKYYRKLIKIERTKSKQMYVLLQEAYSLVQKHKTEMNETQQKSTECEEHLGAIERQSADLARKENELTLRQKALESREQACEQKYSSKLREVEKKLKILEDQDREIHSKYKILQEEQTRLENEKQQLEIAKSRIQVTNSREVEKLEEYERKLSALQDQVLEIVRRSEDKDKIRSDAVTYNREIQCVFDTSNQSQQTENDAFINVEEYVNLVEKENALLKLGSNKQRYRINQLTSEVLALRNKLDYLDSEMQIRKRLEREEDVQLVAHKLYFPSSPREQLAVPTEASRTRRRLAFEESALDSESSNSLSATNRLTDEIVADAKNKLKELEAESEMLNHNFQNLQNVLSRNIAFVEKPGSSSMSDSPRERWRRLTRSANDLDSTISPRDRRLNLSDFDESSPSSRTEVSPVGRKTAAFSRIFQKYRQKKLRDRGNFGSDGELQGSQRSSNVEHPKESADEGVLPHTESEADVGTANVEAIDSAVDEQRDPEGERIEKNDAGISTKITDIKNISKEIPSEGQKLATENSGPSDSTGQSDKVISAGVSNGSSSSDFWK